MHPLDLVKQTTLIISHEWINDIMKIEKSFKVSGLLIKGASETINFFFYLDFPSQQFKNHGISGKGGGHFFNSSLQLLPASQTLRH